MAPPVLEKSHSARTPRTPTSAAAALEGVDTDGQLWHGRKSSIELVKEHAEQTAEAAAAKGGGQGLWAGVVFPCMANILGVILFLRAPWIVGRAGIGNAFGLVFICCLCTFVTSLSLSAVSTNGKIMGGGSYYLISRSMGPALGAGVGLCFYMANSIGAAMYLMGFVEAWEIAAPGAQILKVGDINNVRVSALIMLLVCLIIVGGGIKYVARLGTVFLFIVLFVIFCMYLGGFIGPDQWGTSDGTYVVELVSLDGVASKMTLEWGGIGRIGEYFKDNWGTGWTAPQLAYPSDTTEYNFISMMGLWFPANTGIMAGSNRSADLKDPSGTIPKGTLFAQISTSCLYLSFIVFYGCIAPRETLLNDKFFAATAAWPLKEVVIYGVMASTLGAGLTSLTSGTRLLSAIAADKTLPILRFFAATPGKEPRLALLASGVLCACAIGIGELNAVAPVLTMFFLMCYTCVNASCTISEAVQDPNWRPTWRYYHWSISLFGFVQCILMMFFMDAIKAVIAMAFCTLVILYSAYHSHAVKWGDGFQGMKFQLARNILLKMDQKVHTKNWRPQVLVVTEAQLQSVDSEEPGENQIQVNNPELLKLVSQMKGGRGITIIGAVCSAKGEDAIKERGFFLRPNDTEALQDGYEAMKQLMKDYQIEGFGHLMYTEHFLDGLQSLIQVAGLGSFQPNCILAAWPQDDAWKDKSKAGYLARSRVLRMTQMAVAFDKVMLIAKGKQWPGLEATVNGVIDIWWIVGDGGILLLLPFLFKKHKTWSGCRTRLFLIAEKVGADPLQMEADLKSYVRDFRLDVEVKIKVVDPDAVGLRPSTETEAAENQDQTIVDETKDEPASSSQDAGASAAGTVFSLDNPPADMIRPVLPELLGPRARPSGAEESGEPNAPKKPTGPMIEPENPRRVTSSPALLENQKPKTSITGGNSGNNIGGRVRPNLERQLSPTSSAGAGWLDANQLTNLSVDSLKREMEGQGRHRGKQFVNSSHQLSSTVPCSKEELNIATALGNVMMEESMDSDLVVTNLPDMPPDSSAYGYFELVDEITKHLRRTILVRGTSSEVIAQFT